MGRDEAEIEQAVDMADKLAEGLGRDDLAAIEIGPEEEDVDQHAGDAACLWSRREAACRSSAYRLADLAFLDQRIDAHLDGLRLAGDEGWDACLDALDAAEEPADLFAPAAIAAESDDPRPMGKVLDATKGEAEGLRIVAAALGWASPSALGRVLERLLAPRCPPVLHTLGLTAGNDYSFNLFFAELRNVCRNIQIIIT